MFEFGEKKYAGIKIAVLICKGNKFLLMQEKGQTIWQRPKQIKLINESLDEAALKIARQETGLKVQIYTSLDVFEEQQNQIIWNCMGFLAEYKSGKIRERSDFIFAWFSLKDLPSIEQHTLIAIKNCFM